MQPWMETKETRSHPATTRTRLSRRAGATMVQYQNMHTQYMPRSCRLAARECDLITTRNIDQINFFQRPVNLNPLSTACEAGRNAMQCDSTALRILSSYANSERASRYLMTTSRTVKILDKDLSNSHLCPLTNDTVKVPSPWGEASGKAARRWTALANDKFVGVGTTDRAPRFKKHCTPYCTA